MLAILDLAAEMTLAATIVATALIAADQGLRRKRGLRTSSFAWILTGLYLGPVAWWAYIHQGRSSGWLAASQVVCGAESKGAPVNHRTPSPTEETITGSDFPVRSLEDRETPRGEERDPAALFAEWPIFLAGWLIAGLAFWPSLLVTFGAPFLAGMLFLYVLQLTGSCPDVVLEPPCERSNRGQALSIFQVGVLGWTALARFVLLHHEVTPWQPIYWLMLQTSVGVGLAGLIWRQKRQARPIYRLGVTDAPPTSLQRRRAR